MIAHNSDIIAIVSTIRLVYSMDSVIPKIVFKGTIIF